MNLYYAGLYIDAAGSLVDGLDEYAFGPVDDLGRPDAGAIHIKHLTHGKWGML